MLIPPFVAGMGAVGYGPALHLLPSTLAVLVGGRVEGLSLFATSSGPLKHEGEQQQNDYFC
jgi:hypothetical protein